MTHEQWIELAKLIIVALISGGLTFVTTHYRRPQVLTDEHEKNISTITNTSTETIAKLMEQVNGLIERDIEKEARIRELERTNKQYINAYNRAFLFIKKRLPAEDIPDFMITQDLRLTKPGEK